MSTASSEESTPYSVALEMMAGLAVKIAQKIEKNPEYEKWIARIIPDVTQDDLYTESTLQKAAYFISGLCADGFCTRVQLERWKQGICEGSDTEHTLTPSMLLFQLNGVCTAKNRANRNLDNTCSGEDSGKWRGL